MNLQYVHLSTDEKTAEQVGESNINSKEEEEQQAIMSAISAIEAHNTGVYCFC